MGPAVRRAGQDGRPARVPPGFGAPIPDGFGCTVPAYRDLLVAELETLGEPVNLVGHDVGGSTVVCVAMKQPDLLRTWVSDYLGVFDRTMSGTTSPGNGKRLRQVRSRSRT